MADKSKKQAEVKTIEQLQTELEEKQNDILEAKTGLAAGELVNPRALRSLRKDIARLKTAIRVRELESTKEDK